MTNENGNMVTLFDGRIVSSSSREWMEECDARCALKIPPMRRTDHFAAIEAKRGVEALRKLKWLCRMVEPAFVLGLPNRQQRNAYLRDVQLRYGPEEAETLRERVIALHEKRKSVASNDEHAT